MGTLAVGSLTLDQTLSNCSFLCSSTCQKNASVEQNPWSAVCTKCSVCTLCWLSNISQSDGPLCVIGGSLQRGFLSYFAENGFTTMLISSAALCTEDKSFPNSLLYLSYQAVSYVLIVLSPYADPLHAAAGAKNPTVWQVSDKQT